MRRILVSAAVAVALVVPLLAIPAADAVVGPVVPATQFGMTVNGLGGTASVPAGTGSVRLWDVGATWAQINPSLGVYNWAPLDAAVTRARAMGVRDIDYVLGSTPYWARIPYSAERGDSYGPGSASHPARDSYYLDFLRAVVTRYKGRITSYEIWNEANLSGFYRGTPTQLARLTLASYRLIKSLDPRAIVGSPSWYLRFWAPQREAQLAALRAVGWPFDFVSVHGYPYPLQGPDNRATLLASFKARLAALGVHKPIWDTEANFGNRRAGFPIRTYVGAAAAQDVARAYIDSLRYGVARTYWYSWDAHTGGIDMIDALGRPTAAGVAFSTLSKWVVGLHWNGCTTASNGISRCALMTSTGAKRSIIYTPGGAVKTTVPLHAFTLCSLDGRCRTVKPGTVFYLTGAPRFVVGA